MCAVIIVLYFSAWKIFSHIQAGPVCQPTESTSDWVFSVLLLQHVQCCLSEGKQPLVHHMGGPFETDTQRARTDWFCTNQLQIIFPLEKYKRTHFPLEWATIQRAIFRSHSSSVWGTGSWASNTSPCLKWNKNARPAWLRLIHSRKRFGRSFGFVTCLLPSTQNVALQL